MFEIVEDGSLIWSGYQGYGCPGLSLTASAIATAEVARVDASCSTFILVHSSLAMLTIGEILIKIDSLLLIHLLLVHES